MALSGSQLARLNEAIRGAFKRSALEQQLSLLDRRLDDISLGEDYLEQVHELLQQAREEGWIDRLLDTLVAARTENQDFVRAVAAIRAEKPAFDWKEAFSSRKIRERPFALYAIVATAGILVVFVIVWLRPDGEGHPTDPFFIYMVHEDSEKLKVSSWSFPASDIARKRKPKDFHELLADLPGEKPSLSSARVFRLADEEILTSSDGDPLEGGNKGVLVVPIVLVERFDDAHVAFTFFKSQIPK